MKPSGFYVDPDYLFQDNRFSLSDPPGARTQDPNIKSVVLYLLS